MAFSARTIVRAIKQPRVWYAGICANSAAVVEVFDEHYC